MATFNDYRTVWDYLSGTIKIPLFYWPWSNLTRQVINQIWKPQFTASGRFMLKCETPSPVPSCPSSFLSGCPPLHIWSSVRKDVLICGQNILRELQSLAPLISLLVASYHLRQLFVPTGRGRQRPVSLPFVYFCHIGAVTERSRNKKLCLNFIFYWAQKCRC